MANYFLTNKAVEDLAGIWDYTYETWSELQADKYYNALLSSCSKLVKNPGMGRKYHNIYNELQGFRSGHHIIFYRRINKADIEVIRILHERMDLEQKFQE